MKLIYWEYRIIIGKLHLPFLKTNAVKNFLEQKCTKDIQSYLGLIGHFRKFLKDYSVLRKPLSDLLRKGAKFRFDIEEMKTFNELLKYFVIRTSNFNIQS